MCIATTKTSKPRARLTPTLWRQDKRGHPATHDIQPLLYPVTRKIHQSTHPTHLPMLLSMALTPSSSAAPPLPACSLRTAGCSDLRPLPPPPEVPAAAPPSPSPASSSSPSSPASPSASPSPPSPSPGSDSTALRAGRPPRLRLPPGLMLRATQTASTHKCWRQHKTTGDNAHGSCQLKSFLVPTSQQSTHSHTSTHTNAQHQHTHTNTHSCRSQRLSAASHTHTPIPAAAGSVLPMSAAASSSASLLSFASPAAE